MKSTPTTVSSDEELAQRAQGGCTESFEELVRRFQVPVLEFLRRRGLSSDAEDLLQETFIRAYANLHRYRRRWRFSTWLFTIARRVSINHARRVRPTAGEEALQDVESTAPGPLETIVAEEDRRTLWGAAANLLRGDEYTAVWLYYVEEMPTREIAVVLERSWVSVKTMLFRARRKLRTLFLELGADVAFSAGAVSSDQHKPARPPVEAPHA
ncbi:MAG: sigma-70 family RNA polymerase sigma factor [Planctomycetes bacterium]|nr:sigma-70 family RNA polymerase sigma factor [Planctomycetota bacterium]